MLRVIAVIPARYNSTRFPGKPLADICGKPMIYHVYQRACSAQLPNEVIVATDDKRIYEVVEDFGGKVMMTSNQHKTGTDRVAEVASLVEGDIFVNIQGDEPGIHPDAIDAVTAPLLSNPDLYVTNLMGQLAELADLLDSTIVKVVKDLQDFFLYLTRSPIPFPRTRSNYCVLRQIGVYAFRRDFLLQFAQMPQTPLERIEGIEFLRILEHGYRVKGVFTTLDSFDVDTPDDLEDARNRLASNA